MKTPTVAVTPLYREDGVCDPKTDFYTAALTRAGARFHILSVHDDPADAARRFDAFLFTGGDDVSPSLYGQQTRPVCGHLCPERDALELPLCREVVALDKPFLGVCRGLQVLNVALDGTLWQDLPSERPSPVCHLQTTPHDTPAHTVEMVESSPLFAVFGSQTLTVNSLHHQAVRTVAPSLNVIATAPDGVCEGLWRPQNRFVFAVQWHPEQLPCAESDALFKAFVEA